MKRLEVGDKVRFLNSVGGGTVKGFQSKQIVIIEDEHNFDVPVLISECVVIEPSDSKKLSQSIDEITETISIIEEPVVPKTTSRDTAVEETLEGEKITTALMFLPTDPKSFSQSNFECFFVNDSNYFLFINYMSRENNTWRSRHSGILEPNTQILIEEFDKSTLNEIEQVCVQFVAFKHNKQYRFKNPVSVELRIDTVKFYKLHAFTENDYFEDDALTFYITRNDVPEQELLISQAHIQQALQEKESSQRRPAKKAVTKKEKNPIIEVDLHINQLLDTTAGMNNADMLNYQLDKFHETMQNNIKLKGQKIVFIHGKGDGVLKSSILKELRNKYKHCYVQDASFKEYGYGATMVTIK